MSRTFKAVLPALTKKSTAKINATPSLGSPNIVAEASRTTIAPEGTVAAVFPISESIKMDRLSEKSTDLYCIH